MSNIEVEIDCPPGCVRPDDILRDVLKGLSISFNDFKQTSTCFGNWVFQLVEGKEDEFLKNQPILGRRLEKAYHDGRIRYASW